MLLYSEENKGTKQFLVLVAGVFTFSTFSVYLSPGNVEIF